MHYFNSDWDDCLSLVSNIVRVRRIVNMKTDEVISAMIYLKKKQFENTFVARRLNMIK